MKLKRILCAAALIAALSMLFAPAALAEGEEGESIGNFADENDTASGSIDTETNFISVSGGMEYDASTRMYRRTVQNGTFSISVPDGAVVTGEVSVSADSVLTPKLYRNGEEVADVDLTSISDPGKYVLAVTENNEATAVRVYFTIVSSPTGDIQEYRMPEDFYVMSATCNGEDVTAAQSYVDMSAEGDYEIIYRCPKTAVEYTLQVTVDHTAPTLTITGLTDNKANGPVTITKDEQSTRVYVQRNDKDYTFSETLTETGVYTVTAQDTAGNQTVYEFVIVNYMNTSAWMFAAAVAIILLGLAAYLFYSRRHVRVR